MVKVEPEVAELGVPHSSAPMTSVVITMPSDYPVHDHIIWSLFNTLFMNWFCLGFVAFSYSVKCRDRKMVGDLIGAQSHSSIAKSLNICALILGLIMTVIFIVVAVTKRYFVVYVSRQ